MIWHLLIAPILRLLGNLIGYRPDVDSYVHDGADEKALWFVLWALVPITAAVIVWALLWA
jgi:hypothetical protein